MNFKLVLYLSEIFFEILTLDKFIMLKKYKQISVLFFHKKIDLIIMNIFLNFYVLE